MNGKVAPNCFSICGIILGASGYTVPIRTVFSSARNPAARSSIRRYASNISSTSFISSFPYWLKLTFRPSF